MVRLAPFVALSTLFQSGTKVARNAVMTGKQVPENATGTLKRVPDLRLYLERKTGFEPATLTLAT